MHCWRNFSAFNAVSKATCVSISQRSKSPKELFSTAPFTTQLCYPAVVGDFQQGNPSTRSTNGSTLHSCYIAAIWATSYIRPGTFKTRMTLLCWTSVAASANQHVHEISAVRRCSVRQVKSRTKNQTITVHQQARGLCNHPVSTSAKSISPGPQCVRLRRCHF